MYGVARRTLADNTTVASTIAGRFLLLNVVGPKQGGVIDGHLTSFSLLPFVALN